MALPYPTKVVLPFDIATAQDMNERHANDVALANGSGLDGGAVTADKLDFTTGIWWEELGRASISGAATSVSASFTSKKFMKFIAIARCGSAGNPTIGVHVNNDTSTNYRRNQIEISSGTITATSSPSGAIINVPTVPNGGEVLFEITASRSAASRIWTFISTVAGTTTKYGGSTWTSADINSFSVVASVSNSLAAGSEVIILGHN